MRTVSRRAAAFAVSTGGVAALSMTMAVASPPTPLLTKIDDAARAQLVEGGTVGTPVGTDSVSAGYTLAPGSGTGWRTTPGTSVLAVTEGVLTLRSAEGCATKEYRAGQAAVVPAGRYLLANAGGEPVEFAGIFVKLTKGSAQPLVDGAGEAAPAGCTGASAHSAASTAGAAVVDLALPGFSSGWPTHVPAFAIVTRGTFTYYEDFGGGRCAKSEVYTPGQAFTHVGGFHLGANEGTEPVTTQSRPWRPPRAPPRG